MIPVESSNVAAIGYQCPVMTVEYRDGSRYQYTTDEGTHAVLMASGSKGSELAALLKNGAIVKGVKLNGPVRGAATVAKYATVQTAIRINVTQAEGCCGVALNDASLGGQLGKADSFACNKCGTEYRPTMFGPLAHWEPVETAELVR